MRIPSNIVVVFLFWASLVSYGFSQNDTLIYPKNDSHCTLSIPGELHMEVPVRSYYLDGDETCLPFEYFHLQFYNRWGIPVFETNSPQKTWLIGLQDQNDKHFWKLEFVESGTETPDTVRAWGITWVRK